MIADGSIISRPGDNDPDAIDLMRRLSIVSRRRWPEVAETAVKVGDAASQEEEAAAPLAEAPAQGRARGAVSRLSPRSSPLDRAVKMGPWT